MLGPGFSTTIDFARFTTLMVGIETTSTESGGTLEVLYRDQDGNPRIIEKDPKKLGFFEFQLHGEKLPLDFQFIYVYLTDGKNGVLPNGSPANYSQPFIIFLNRYL